MGGTGVSVLIQKHRGQQFFADYQRENFRAARLALRANSVVIAPPQQIIDLASFAQDTNQLLEKKICTDCSCCRK
jgi:hypothetical protein